MSIYDADALRRELAGYKARGLKDRVAAVEALLKDESTEVDASIGAKVETTALVVDDGKVERRPGGRRS